MSEGLRSRIAAIIRQDLAEEAAAGFPLLRRFPNSETAAVPDRFAALSAADRGSLIDALAHYSITKWSHEIVNEKRAHRVLGPYLAKRPLYPPGDWYGARPKKSAIKGCVVECLANAGFVRMKPQSSSQPDVIAFSHPDPSFAGRLLISLDPGFPRQLDFGFRDWLRGELAEPLKFESPREFIPVIRQLAYDHLWHGAGVNNPVCWDVITEANLEETGRLMVGVLGRLASLAARINGLGAS